MTDREDNARLKQIRARDATIASQAADIERLRKQHGLWHETSIPQLYAENASQAAEIAALKAHIERGREMANLIRRAPDAVTHVWGELLDILEGKP